MWPLSSRNKLPGRWSEIVRTQVLKLKTNLIVQRGRMGKDVINYLGFQRELELICN